MSVRKQNILYAALLILSLGLAGLVVWLGFQGYWREIDAAWLTVSMLFGGAIGAGICAALHELGHILAGKLQGFRFQIMRIGFFCLKFKNGKPEITFSKLSDSLAGATEMIPEKTDHMGRRVCVMLVGGLLFSCLSLAGCIISVIFYGKVPAAVYFIWGASLPYSFYLFFRNILPFTGTDGEVLFSILKKENSATVLLRLFEIEGEYWKGFTPAEIGKERFFDLPQLPEDDFNFILLTDYRLNYCLDAGDLDGVLSLCDRLEELLEYVPEFYFNDIAADVLFCECALRNRVDVSRRMYAVLKDSLTEDLPMKKRILAAYKLYIENDIKSASEDLKRALSLAEKFPIKGIARFESKLINALLSDCQTLQTQNITANTNMN